MTKNTLISFAVVAICIAALSFFSYSSYQKYKNLVKKVSDLSSEVQRQNKTLGDVDEALRVRVEKMSVQISVLDESISPKDKRWAKIKKVREAVQSVIKQNHYNSYMDINTLTAYCSSVVDFSEQYDVSIPLILAVTTRESAFNPVAVSHAGAQGLMQLMPETSKELASDLGRTFYNVFKVRDNVQLGTWYLWKLMDIFKGDADLAVRAYNSGPTVVRKVLAKEQGFDNYYNETIEYHDAVMKWKKFYEDFGL